ncbi:Rz1-like lysis system protein LysC [Haemophilus parahaemolyticus]
MKALKQFWLKSRVLVCLCLVLLLSSCSQRVTIKTEYLAPPQAYLTPCTQTAFTGETYGDAIDYLVVVMSERDLCAKQVEQIRIWATKQKEK